MAGGPEVDAPGDSLPLEADGAGVERKSQRASAPRVVITHDFMETFGGAERVTAEIARAFPDAPVYALLARSAVARRMGIADRVTTLLPARPAVYRHYRLLAPVLGAIADRTRLPEADVVLSSSYAYAHRLRSANDAPRVCYCHSPLRFAWSMTDAYGDVWAPRSWQAPAFRALAAAQRRSDRRSADQVAAYLTQSPFTAEQIERFYGRPAEIIGVPIDRELFSPGPEAPEDYFLLCARLVEPYKRVTVAIEAFLGLRERLVIAGSGPALEDLRRHAPSNVEFVGHLDDADLVAVMRRCRAAIFPSRDDFGLIPLEVQACGRPVLAYGEGGALYTVVAGVTGEFFDAQTATSLREALRRFDPDAYDPVRIRDHTADWDRGRFDRLLRESVERAFKPTGR